MLSQNSQYISLRAFPRSYQNKRNDSTFYCPIGEREREIWIFISISEHVSLGKKVRFTLDGQIKYVQLRL